MAFTTWNPSDKTAAVTLSGGNLIATCATGQGGGRSVDRQISKLYWEVTPTVFAQANSSVGIMLSTASITGWWLNGSASVGTCGVNHSGNAVVDGATSVGNPAFGVIAAGTVICIAVDVVNKLIWYRLGAAGNWNNNAANNPATGVGGLPTGTLGGGMPIYAGFWGDATNEAFTANFGATTFTGAVPAGFTSGFVAGASFPTNTLVTQSTLEQFLTTPAPAQVTQVAVEQWVATTTITGQALVTQVALEQWVPAPKATVDLAGNLGAPSHYGKLSYGLKHYSRISAFAPVFSADLTIAPAVNFAGDLAPTIVLAADLDVHVNLIEFAGDLSPQIALAGSLSLLVPLNALEGSFGFSVLLAASSFVSGPLWADSEPCPSPPWAPSEPCPPPPWMTTAPCAPVVWSKSRMCNG